MKTLEAVIELGSTGVRLMVCEVDSDGNWNIIDRSELSVSLGWDVFISGSISTESLLHCVHIFEIFREQLAGWSIKPFQVRTIATSALREAKNRDSVLDRILIKTGFPVKVIDGIEESRLMYLAVLDTLRQDLPTQQNKNSIILEIGGGSTEIMLLEKGKIATVHSLRLGTVIIDQYIKSMGGSRNDTKRYLEDFIKNTGVNLNFSSDLQKIQQFITIGSDAQIIAKEIGVLIGNRTWSISRESFYSFVNEFDLLSVEEYAGKLKAHYNDVKSLPISLLVYKLFLDLTQAQEIIVSDTTIREGLFISKFSKNIQLQENFFTQILAAALNIGRRFKIDERHAKHVKKIALKIYDVMESELGFQKEARLFLEIAALLHDVGTFIRESDHEIHSHYIISHSNIFGLEKNNINIIALIARYHRNPLVIPDDSDYISLPRKDRMHVLKLSAILRIADALDRGHSQRIENVSVSLREAKLIIELESAHDTNLEKQAVREKADLFESVFAYTVLTL